jgi:mannose-6-phosphate isomerase-like protein (cupin superfamily)
MQPPDGAPLAGSVSNLYRDHLRAEAGCHGGQGAVDVFRPYLRAAGAGVVDFIDLVVVPPGASIGRHAHGDNTEWYVILDGSAVMWFGQRERAVGRGDILVNPPHGEHGLVNHSAGALTLLVFQVSSGAAAPDH